MCDWNIKPAAGSNSNHQKSFLFCSGNILCLIVRCHIMLFLIVSASLCRLEFQHGLSLPVPQLESVCGGVCTPVCLCGSSSHFYAWEPPLLPGGKRERQYIMILAAPFSLLMTLIMTLKNISKYLRCLFYIYFLHMKNMFIYQSENMLNSEVFKLLTGWIQDN